MKKAALKDWGRKFFRKEIFYPGEPRHLEAAAREAAFVVKALGLKKGDNILDVCCGTGRHSVQFAKRGLNVVGLDATPAYLDAARKAGRKFKDIRFLRGDMRRIPFQSEFDGAINLWTSFGYFLRFEDDLKTLRGIARALKPGGRFLIDIIDADFLRKHGIEKHWDRLADGGYRLEEFKTQEGRDPGHTNTWTILKPGRKPATATFFVRNYDYERLSRTLKRAGLIPARRWGDLDGGRYRRGETARLVVLARKPR